MQDRFKFRVWNKEQNRFHHSFCCDITASGTLVISQGIEGKKYIVDDDNYVVQQCTGLKDKNGKLIYEGDILKVELGGYPKRCFINKAVIWDRKRWVLAKKRNCKGTPKECQHCKHCERIEARKEWFFQTSDTNFKSFYMNEVIGNIYENTELLEVSNDH